jgi:hypothetical protein
VRLDHRPGPLPDGGVDPGDRPAGLAALSAHAVFDVLVVAHVICAVVGFGSLMLSGVYGFSNRSPRPESLEEARRYFAAPGHLELLVVAVPFLGLAALLVQPGGRGAGQLWDLAASAVWLAAAAVLFAVVRPAERDIRTALGLGAGEIARPGAGAPGDGTGPAGSGDRDIDLTRLGEAARRLGWAGVTTDIAFFVALLLMIFQPR